jgi:hypothetical protein
VRLLRLAIVVAALAVPLVRVLPTADAGVIPRGDMYLHRLNGATADPVNVIFRNGSSAQAAQAVQQVLGWSPTNGSELQFWRADEPPLTSLQLALDLGGGSRYHIRIEQAQAAANEDVLAGVHLDVRDTCGHIGQRFDEARDLLARGFENASYEVSTITLGNRQAGRQCNGSFTHGDGDAVIVNLARSEPSAP